MSCACGVWPSRDAGAASGCKQSFTMKRLAAQAHRFFGLVRWFATCFEKR